FFALALLLCASSLFAQGTPEDFERSRTLSARTQGKVRGGDVAPNWYADGKFWFRDAQGAHVLVDPAARTRTTMEKDKLPPGAKAAAAPRIMGKGRRPDFSPRQTHSARTDLSPDRKHRVTLKENNLVLDGDPFTKDATEKDAYERGVFWSPDGSKFIALRT